MAEALVKWYIDAKGHGFIESDDGVGIFAHKVGIDNRRHGELRNFERVSFDMEPPPGCLRQFTSNQLFKHLNFLVCK